jgi:Protein of unknown function (DUF2721)
MLETPPISHLSQVISQSIAPAFVLGAVAGFISILVTRLNRIIDRCRTIAAGDQEHGPIGAAGIDLSRLNARADLINRSIFLAVGSALSTLLLMIVAFAAAFLDLPHERGVGLLFVVALVLFSASLVNFAREIRIVIRDPNNFD